MLRTIDNDDVINLARFLGPSSSSICHAYFPLTQEVLILVPSWFFLSSVFCVVPRCYRQIEGRLNWCRLRRRVGRHEVWDR